MPEFGSAQALSITLTPSDHHGYNVSCFGGGDGAIDLSVTGGTAPYTYLWSTGATTQDVAGLRAGYVSVTVLDATNVDARGDLTLTEPYELRAEVEPFQYTSGYNISCYNCYNGSIQVTTLEGVSPYTYAWADGPTTEDRTQLDAGSYDLLVTDANGCEFREDHILLTQPERDDWTKSGNAGTTPGTQFIGTTDNQDVVFKSNSAEVLRLKSNGDIKLSGSLTEFGLLYRDENGMLRSGTLPDHPLMLGSPCRQNEWYHYWKTGGNEFDLLCPEEFPLLGTQDDHPVHMITNGELRMQIDEEGRVSVGTEAPDDQFEVHTTMERSGITLNNALEDDNAHTEIRFMKSDTGRWALGCDFLGNGGQDFFLWDHTAGANRLRVDSAGRVLIGGAEAGTSPLYKLYVEGGIVSRDVLVTANNLPDYVFEAGYDLMPLEAVADYIRTEGHLPHMPSAQEARDKGGVEVGDLQQRLLRTVEEQQLYILQLRAEMDRLQQRLFELEKH